MYHKKSAPISIFFLLAVSLSSCIFNDLGEPQRRDEVVLSDSEAVALDKQELDVNDILFSSGDSSVSVRENFFVPISGRYGSSIHWSSEPPGYAEIAEDGTATVTRPDAITGDLELTLTATLTRREAMDTKEITVTILADTVFPELLSFSPEHNVSNVAPCSGSPCRGQITLLFSESMDSSQITHTLTTAIDYNGFYTSVDNTTLNGSWSQTNVADDTLTITISWLHWPENAGIQWSLDTSNFRDRAGNTTAASVSDREFFTGSRHSYFPLADTGLTECYDDGLGSISCADSGFPLQDAYFADIPNARSFTSSQPVTEEYIVTDNVTGLVWKRCSEGLSGSDCASGSSLAMSWDLALDQCSALNSSTYGGRMDWRLPSVSELQTLSNIGQYDPAIDAASFPATEDNYWSSSDFISGTSDAWYIRFTDGYVGSSGKTVNNYNVRCVSGGDTGERAYTDNDDYTVTDSTTGLIWQKCSMGQNEDSSCSGTATTGDWSEALSYCNDLSLDGQSWRLPSVNEFKTVINRYQYDPAIDTSYFPATVADFYWSSSSYVNGISDAWYIRFSDGRVGSSSKTVNSYYVRCVTGP